MKPIDYTALIQPLSFRNIQMRVSARKFWLSVVYLILATVAFVLFAVLRLNGFMANIMDIGLIVSIVILAKVLADLITLITHANREIQAEQFAELNGFMLLRNVKKPPL
jgi:hypothetical protein